MIVHRAMLTKQPTLNIFAALPKDAKIETRKQLIKYLADEKNVPGKYTIPLDKVQNHYPMATSNFSDFFCSLEHARNVCPVQLHGYVYEKILKKGVAVCRSNQRPLHPQLLRNPQRLQRPHLQPKNHQHPHPPSLGRNPAHQKRPTNLHPVSTPRLRARNGRLHL